MMQFLRKENIFLFVSLGLFVLLQRFLDPNYWITGTKTDFETMKVKVKDDKVILRYHLLPGDWAYALLAETPILPDTKHMTLDVHGQNKREKLYIDLFDQDTDSSLRWVTTVDWDGWRHLDLPYDVFHNDGEKNISLTDIDSLKISVESQAALAGEIQLREYNQAP